MHKLKAAHVRMDMPDATSMPGDSGPGPSAFAWDRVTVLCYGSVSSYAFWLYAFGPALAFLRAELHFSYAVVGVYSALWAGGAAAVGVSFAWACRRIGRRPVLWWSVLGASCAAAVFITGRSVPVTLAAAAVLGLAGTMVLTTTQSVLSDLHGERRERALVESNVGAGVCAVVAPLALGLLQATPVTWRAAMALPAVAFAVLFLVYRRQALPEHPASGARLCPLPKLARLLAALVAVGIGIEFCVVYFGAELLSATTSLSTKAAVTAMALFYAGLLAGRVAGGALARTPGRGSRLLSASLAVTLAGVLALWLPRQAVIALAGLFVTGVGIANLYPLSLALTLAAAPGQTDAANARSQLLGGLAVVVAPLALGGLADHVGLSAAFGVEPLLVVICWLLLRAGTGSGLLARTAGAPGTGTTAR